MSTRNLPDVTVEDFSKVDLRQFKWIHWEVNNKYTIYTRQILLNQTNQFHFPIPSGQLEPVNFFMMDS